MNNQNKAQSQKQRRSKEGMEVVGLLHVKSRHAYFKITLQLIDNNLDCLLMKQAYSSSPELISEQQMLLATSECYILLQKYKLKTNLVGINMPKDLIQENYSFLEERMTDRYQKMQDKLKEGLNKLHINFMIAQGNSLRTLNNIFRNYRRRVGTLANEPLSSLKYNKYDRQEKLILESIIYNERDSFSELLAFKQEIEKNIENGKKEIEEKYRQSEKIKENYKVIFDVIDKTECYTYKYYDNFERSMHTTINNLQTNFDKLNAFLSVWENVGSTKAYEIKSLREIQSEEKSHENDRNRRYYEQETEEQLEELMKNCPQHSPQRQEYRKRLNQLRRYNSEKQKKLDMVGKMYSKRRNRAGILVNKNKEISVLEWVINLDNSKIPYNYHDQFKNYRADNEHTDYRLTPYESQKPMKSAEDIKDHLEKYRSTPILNFQWWYDRFGKEGNVDLITSWSQQIQKRIEFQVVRQTELQNSDDRRKRQLLEKQNYQMKENERRQCLHIGYLHAHDKTQLQSLMERSYNTQYIPELVGNQDYSDISFSQEEDNDDDQPVQQPLRPANTVTKASLLKNKEQFPFVKIEDKTAPAQTAKEASLAKENIAPIATQQADQADMSLEQQIIKIYFKEYSKKIIRKQSQPQYRKTQFLYFRSVGQIKWASLATYLDYQKIFIYTPKSILYFNKIFSASQEKMKCNIYTVQEEDQEGEEERQLAFKQNIRACFKNSSLVTVKFHPIYLDNENLTAFMIGLLIVLMRQGKMLEDYELKDFVNEGKEIVEDFNQYFFPQDNRSTKSIFMRKFKPHISQDVFAPSKKADKSFEAESIKTTTETTMKTQYSAPKETKQQLQKPITQIKQVSSEQPVNNVTKQETTTPILPKIREQPIAVDEYSRLHEQRQLKRSNSREFITNYEMQIQLNNLQEEYPTEGKDSNDADYEQL